MQHGAAHRETDATVDSLPPAAALRMMLDSQVAAAQAVGAALPAIEAAAEAVAGTLAAGGRLVYAAAGSSGLMALADACELPGTFGIDPARIAVVMAGGVPVDARMPGATEDGTDEAEAGADALGPGDTALVLSASGTTPFALAFAARARARGARVVGIAAVPGSALLAAADIAVALPTAPEVIEGSTRLGAGTAQKIALNMISTQAGVRLGHVHAGMMVNLVADNAKLRRRAAGIVARIAGVDAVAAAQALEAAGHDTKRAVLIAAGAAPEAAGALLDAAGGRLAACLPEVQARETHDI